MNESVRETLAGLNATYCLREDISYEHQIDALPAAVNHVLESSGQNWQELLTPEATPV